MTGTLKATLGSAAAPSLTFNGDENTGFYRSSNDTIGFTTGGTERMSLSGSALVGQPGYSPYIKMNGGGNVGNPSYAFRNENDTGMWLPAADTLAFSNGGTETMRITATGDVGIGTVNPSRDFQVEGISRFQTNSASVAPVIELVNTNNSTGQGPSTLFRNGNVTLASISATRGSSDSSGDLTFSTRSGSVVSPRLHINTSGNLGIGTDNPLRPLHLYAATAAPTFLWERASNNLDEKKRFLGLDGNGSYNFGSFSDDMSSTNYHMTIDVSGQVGIGSTAPTVALDVVGDIQYTGTITDVSDRRRKENIKPLAHALETVKAVDGVSFIMKGDEKQRIEFGVIAQDLEDVLPELVHTANDELKTKSVNYVGFIGWIIEAIKDLASNDSRTDREFSRVRQELKEKEKRISALENEVKELRALIEEKLH